MAQRKKRLMVYGAIVMLAAFSLSLLGPASVHAQFEGPGTICVLQVFATGNVMAMLVDDTRRINTAVLVPHDNVTNFPIRCMDLDRLGLGVANQEAFQVSFNAHIYTNKGELQCSKGPFNVVPNGGRGVSFESCL